MKAKITKSILLVFSLVCMLCFQISPVYANPDDSQLQVATPAQLEIQLGPDWSGVEFELKTDAGLYPGTIVVGEDGVLRMEIGGSSSYILSCLDSCVSVPEPTQAPATTEGDETEEQETQVPQEETEEPNTIAGIPVLHIVLFGGGLLLAVAALIGMRIASRKHAVDADYEEDDE